ncbi:MAG TPA: hypothetical protein PKD64_14550, partial [Pirellulaceae bacterium]|nr:hypothetical protein [Pirellulaceae bacterium]HMO93402.1 hypothetical protein [Pirellulaceae bacterium]
GGRGAGADMIQRMQEMEKEFEKEVLAVLSDSQQNKYQEMKGKPFEFPQQGQGQRQRRQDF